MKIIYIKWIDAVSDDNWVHSSELKPEFHTCETLGFLVSEDKSGVVVALSRDLNSGNVSSFINIPTQMILSKLYLSRAIVD